LEHSESLVSLHVITELMRFTAPNDEVLNLQLYKRSQSPAPFFLIDELGNYNTSKHRNGESLIDQSGTG